MSSSGNIYAWGLKSSIAAAGGAAGRKKNFAEQHVMLPTKIKKLSGFIACSSFAEYFMALKQDGTVYTWGMNSKGRCGHPTA